MALHSPINGTTAIPWRSSSSSRMRQSLLSVLEQLRACQDAWCPREPWDREMAHVALSGCPTGTFLVVRDAKTSRPSLLCVSAGGESQAVADHHIKCRGTAFQLSDSRLTFSDLVQLVVFYSLTRDVLSVCLSLPRWIYNETQLTKLRLSQLGPKSWLSAPPDLQTDNMTGREPHAVMCAIQLTSTNGALCVINPLYLLEHGDDWLTHRPVSCATPSPNYRAERRLSASRPWSGAGLQNQRTTSLDQESPATDQRTSGLIRAQSADSPQSSPSSSASSNSEAVVYRRPSRVVASNPPSRAGSRDSCPSTPTTPGGFGNTHSDLQHVCSPSPLSPHRVSWIEDGVWFPPPRPPSLLNPPYLELDSLSISSIEEEQEPQTSSVTPPQPSTPRLADKVINRLSAMSQAIGGLVCQKKRLTNRVLELSEKKSTAFAEAIKVFVERTLRRGTEHGEATGTEMLQEVRSSLTSLRETLYDYPEIQAVLDSTLDLQDAEIDSLVEMALHKAALKPVSAHLYSLLRTARTDDGSLPRLQSNQRVLEHHGVEELGGSKGVGVPDPNTLERMQQRWSSMHQSYSPNKKVQILLKVCKSIYHSMSANVGSDNKVFGADDFLPCLTWVLLRSDVVTLQLDTDYMMELLDPMQLQGEGGYYLTTLYAALYYISSFRQRLAVRQASAEAQHSINQWHRRRTLHCNQSRRSKHRQTIRRHAHRERSANKEAAGKEEQQGERENEGDAADAEDLVGENDTSTLEPVREEAVGEEDKEMSQMSSETSTVGVMHQRGEAQEKEGDTDQSDSSEGEGC